MRSRFDSARRSTARSRGRSAIPLLFLLSAVFLTACSEMITVLARHDCPGPVTVSITDRWDDPVDKMVPPGSQPTEIYGICCEPGQDGELAVSAGPWAETISYDRLRRDPVIVLPAAVCETP